MTTAALQLRQLNKSFGAIAVTRDVNFELPAGARHALIGPNGAGKTTLVNLISGELQPSSGAVLLHGIDVTRKSQAQRSRLGLARTFQITQLFRGLSTLDNVCLAVAERRGVAGSLWRPLGFHSEVIDEAMALLGDFELEAEAATQVSELAYGRQRLVEIVIALAHEPRVLLLDEPAAGVPSAESRIILEAIERLDEAIALMIIEHDMDIVFRFAREVTVLVSGEMLVTGSPAEIASDSTVQELYLGSGSSR